jgi:hypothetical protein
MTMRGASGGVPSGLSLDDAPSRLSIKESATDPEDVVCAPWKVPRFPDRPITVQARRKGDPVRSSAFNKLAVTPRFNKPRRHFSMEAKASHL